MPSDLTERLAAKLYGTLLPYKSSIREAIAETADVILPLLLSEPELVASLPDEVRQDLLGRLLGEAKNLDELCDIWNKAIKRFEEPIDPEEERLSVLTPRERMALEIGLLELDLSKAEAKALTPEGKDVAPLEAP